MNRNLDFIYTINRWFSVHPDLARDKNESALQVPLLCQFMPMRWSYEALVVAQSKWNPLTSRQDKIQKQIDALVEQQKTAPLTAAQKNRLDDLKDTLALLSGLEGKTPEDVAERLRRVDSIIAGKPLDPSRLRSRKPRISAERLYLNQKVTDLVSKAESEQRDYRRAHRINVFFSPEKVFYFTFRGTEYTLHPSVMVFNTVVLLTFGFATLAGLCVTLKRQLRVEK